MVWLVKEKWGLRTWDIRHSNLHRLFQFCIKNIEKEILSKVILLKLRYLQLTQVFESIILYLHIGFKWGSNELKNGYFIWSFQETSYFSVLWLCKYACLVKYDYLEDTKHATNQDLMTIIPNFEPS